MARIEERRLILGSLPGNPLHPKVIEIIVTNTHLDRYIIAGARRTRRKSR